jgi:hypothetical protein
MTLIIFAAGAVVVATLAIFADRHLLKNKQQAIEEPVEQTEPKKVEQTEPETKEKTPLLPDWKKYLPGNKKDVVVPFQKWVSDNVELEPLKQWLVSLSPDAIQALSLQLSGFCSELNCELSWVTEKRMEQDPEIEHMVRDMVISYCTACWCASQGYADFELFKVIDDLEKNPFTKKNRLISSKVFTNLVKEGLAPSVPADLFMSNEKERQAHMAQAIQQAATSDRDSFKRVLRDVLNDETIVATANVAQSSSSSENVSQQDATESEAVESAKKKRRMFGRKVKTETERTEAGETGDEQILSGSPAVS